MLLNLVRHRGQRRWETLGHDPTGVDLLLHEDVVVVVVMRVMVRCEEHMLLWVLQGTEESSEA